ncbi:putative RNase III [Heterostelium album PN500]|uniref:Putative RNase III n=1 Tax=Heterostelium pallidum (strain ATCC 26659 / Pp 5 / PN500) TaxID=670386 RepID=D3BQ07_HETP5|nr:putative RNase III [Heterostelium album PN500]EFA76558.1 putative RNase III [Heterostelium album PN500]|eukprot:XP_020428690.1 putative RNase III [Heterostelium album PN500]
MPSPFKYIVVLDFEATCENGTKIAKQEIIEFPSVIVEVETCKIVDTFREYVKPVHNPRLSAFCTELTGIQQAWVDEAQTFSVVMENHRQWLIKNQLLLPSGERSPVNTFTFLTCGDWDLNQMLPVQYKFLAGSDGKWPSYFCEWINIKKSFEQHYKVPARGPRS